MHCWSWKRERHRVAVGEAVGSTFITKFVGLRETSLCAKPSITEVFQVCPWHPSAWCETGSKTNVRRYVFMVALFEFNDIVNRSLSCAPAPTTVGDCATEMRKRYRPALGELRSCAVAVNNSTLPDTLRTANCLVLVAGGWHTIVDSAGQRTNFAPAISTHPDSQITPHLKTDWP
jgi:hypothetical protein